MTMPRCKRKALKAMFEAAVDPITIDRASILETERGYVVENGRYWEHISDFDETVLRQIDRHWSSSVAQLPASVLPSDACWRRGRRIKLDRFDNNFL